MVHDSHPWIEDNRICGPFDIFVNQEASPPWTSCFKISVWAILNVFGLDFKAIWARI